MNAFHPSQAGRGAPPGLRSLAECAAILLAMAGCSRASSPAPPAESEDVVRVEVKTVESDASAAPVVLLAPSDGSVILPIWIGSNEAQAIALELAHLEVARPLTHDLVGNVIEGLGAHCERVVVTHVEDGTYYARMELTRGKEKATVDSRPSDAIAVALRLGAPIYVNRAVLDQAAIRRPPGVGAWAGLGVEVQQMTAELAPFFHLGEPRGVLIRDVRAESPAASAGLKVGDVLIEVDSRSVSDLDGLNGLALRTDGPTPITVLRDGEPLELSLGAEPLAQH